jgi:hypothetical protein
MRRILGVNSNTQTQRYEGDNEMKKWKIVTALLVVVSGGCGLLTPPAEKHQLKKDNAYWFSYDASRRGGFMLLRNDPNAGNLRMALCSEPAPDVALDILTKLKLEAEKAEIGAKAEGELQQKVVQLAKRTQTIEFLRESLYRLCELSVNTNISNTEIQSLYNKVLQAAVTMALAELYDQETAKLKAEEAKIRVEAEKQAMQDIKRALEDTKLDELASQYDELRDKDLKEPEILSNGQRTTKAKEYADDLARRWHEGKTVEEYLLSGPVEKAREIVEKLKRRVVQD